MFITVMHILSVSSSVIQSFQLYLIKSTNYKTLVGFFGPSFLRKIFFLSLRYLYLYSSQHPQLIFFPQTEWPI